MTTKGPTLTPAERRAAILGLSGQREYEPAVLPGPDGPIDVLVRELTGTEAKDWEIAVSRGAEWTFGYLLQLSLVDPETKDLLFEPADRQMLEGIGVSKLKPIGLIAQRLSGLSDEDVEKAKRSLLNAPSTG